MSTKNRAGANVEEKNVQFLYKDGDDLVFIDRSSRAQITVSKELLGDAADLLTANLPCTVVFFNERPVDVTLPTFVQLVVTALDSVTQRAAVETGAVIHVPPFTRVGDTIKIDTRTHEYVEHVERPEN